MTQIKVSDKGGRLRSSESAGGPDKRADAAVDGEVRPGHERGVIAGKVDHERRHLLGRAHPTDWCWAQSSRRRSAPAASIRMSGVSIVPTEMELQRMPSAA
jgi:hypothetical protein